MALARSVLERLKSSDGRIGVKTLSGVSALVAAIALLVGVLPVMADDGGSPTKQGIQPHVVSYGGGPGGCDFVESDARNELHINNPKSGSYFGPDGTKVTLAVSGNVFNFAIDSPGVAAYDVVVNGGPQNNHYDYYGNEEVGPVRNDQNLHAPPKSSTQFHNLSHINLCYDVEPTTFECGADAVEAVRFGELGLFTGATAQIFTVDGETVCEKLGLFFIDDGETTLNFGTGGDIVTGRADFHKQFDSTDDFEGDFDSEAALQYNGGPAGDFEKVPWCTDDGVAHGDAFGVEWDPGMPDGHTACKVFETEYADATQHTVVYFEFEDPQFR